MRIDEITNGLQTFIARVDWGPGYRVYLARSGRKIVLLLTGGDKRTQSADIKQAKENWHDYQQRTKVQSKRSR